MGDNNIPKTEELNVATDQFMSEKLRPFHADALDLVQRRDQLQAGLAQREELEEGLRLEINELYGEVGKRLSSGQEADSLQKRLEEKEDQLERSRRLSEQIRTVHLPNYETTLKIKEFDLKQAFILGLVEYREKEWDPAMDYLAKAMADMRGAWDQVIRNIARKWSVKIAWQTADHDMIGQPTYGQETAEQLSQIYR